jgi:hypothetical protein
VSRLSNFGWFDLDWYDDNDNRLFEVTVEIGRKP